jgi:hypothetical protein
VRGSGLAFGERFFRSVMCGLAWPWVVYRYFQEERLP